MELDKIHKRVLEIQDQIEKSSPDHQSVMMSELLDVASQIESSLNKVQDDLKELNENFEKENPQNEINN